MPLPYEELALLLPRVCRGEVRIEVENVGATIPAPLVIASTTPACPVQACEISAARSRRCWPSPAAARRAPRAPRSATGPRRTPYVPRRPRDRRPPRASATRRIVCSVLGDTTSSFRSVEGFTHSPPTKNRSGCLRLTAMASLMVALSVGFPRVERSSANAYHEPRRSEEGQSTEVDLRSFPPLNQARCARKALLRKGPACSRTVSRERDRIDCRSHAVIVRFGLGNASAQEATNRRRACRPIRSRPQTSWAPHRSKGGIERAKVPSNVQTLDRSDVENPALPADVLNSGIGGATLVDVQNNPLQPDIQIRGFRLLHCSAARGNRRLPERQPRERGLRRRHAMGHDSEFAIDSIQLLPGSNPVFGLNALGGALSVRMKNGFDFKATRPRRHFVRPLARDGPNGDRSGNFGFYGGGEALPKTVGAITRLPTCSNLWGRALAGHWRRVRLQPRLHELRSRR